MIAKVSVGFIVCGVALISVSAFAQSGKPPCGAFQKLGDGKWNVVKAVKIENGNASVMLKPGTSIGPGTRVSGVDISMQRWRRATCSRATIRLEDVRESEYEISSKIRG